MTESIRERYGKLLASCAQCGTCAASCPVSEVSDFNVRKIVRRLQLDLRPDNGFLSTIPWLCAQCDRCHELCGEGLDLPDLIMALREVALENNLAPAAARQVWDSVRDTGSPYRSLTRTKTSWIDDGVRTRPDSETLCWLGCTPSIMSTNIARATAAVVDEFGGGFRFLPAEPCCGEPLLALGLMREAKQAAEKAVEALQAAAAAGVKRVVTSCAGCYNMFTNSYPRKLGIHIPDVEILHLSQFLSRRPDKILRLAEPLRVTYHDPCSLGRHAGVYDPPREILRSIEGVELVEMDPARERATCCGGGGGLWSVNRQMAMEIASRKLECSTRGLDAEAVVTTCPMCYNNFRYTLKKSRSPLRVFELSEVVALALGM